MRKVGPLFIALVLVAGCKEPPAIRASAGPELRPGNGWVLGRSRDGSVQLLIPSGWRIGVDRATDLMGGLQNIGAGASDGGESSALDQMRQGIAREESESEQAKLAELESKGIVIHAINSSRPIVGETRTKFTVERQRDKHNRMYEEIDEIGRKLFARKPKVDELQLPIGKAVRFSASEPLRDGSTKHQIAYFVIDGKDLYTLRFVTQEPLETVKAVADDVARSLRIKSSAK